MSDKIFYAVSKSTKVHHLAESFSPEDLNDEDLVIIAADSTGWVLWPGGGCPLPGMAPLEYLLRDGSQIGPVVNPSLEWRHGVISRMAEIVAYRPCLPELENKFKEWDGIGMPPLGCKCRYISQAEKKTRLGTIAWRGRSSGGGREEMALIEYDPVGYDLGSQGDFAPEKDAEDLAVEEMLELDDADQVESIDAFCRILYRAGYRRPDQ